MEVSTRVSMEVEGSILYHYVLLINNVSTRVSMEVEGSLCETNVYVKCHQTCQRTNVLNLNVYR